MVIKKSNSINNLIRKSSVSVLLESYAEILEELGKRGVVRTRNNPAADYAEWLAAQKLKLKLEPNSKSGHDGKNKKGQRFQIKGRRVDPTNNSRQLGVIRNLKEKKFDFLIGIIFNRNFRVIEAYQIPHKLIRKYGKYSEHQNGHILQLRGDLLEEDSVRNITSKF